MLLVAPYKANIKNQPEEDKKPVKNEKQKKTNIKKKPRNKIIEENNISRNKESTPNQLEKKPKKEEINERPTENAIDVLNLLRGKTEENGEVKQNSAKWDLPIFHNFCWKLKPNMASRYDSKGKLVQTKIIVSTDEEENYYEDEGNYRIKWPSF